MQQPSLRVSENRDLKNLLLFTTLVTGWLCVDVTYRLFSIHNAFTLITTYALPIFGGTTLLLLRQLERQGSARIPALPACLGLIFIVGGAMFDLLITISYSPDLSREANPYVRTLLDTQHSLAFVYAHGMLTQAAFVLLFCSYWLAFLRHRTIIMDTIVAAGPASRLEFLKAATGAAHLTMRQWLLPLRISEMAILYHWVWVMSVAIVFGVSLLRWYAALEWLEVFEASIPSRALVVSFGVCGSMTGYFLYLWRMFRHDGAQPVVSASAN